MSGALRRVQPSIECSPHAPRLDLSRPAIVGCACGWQIPQGTRDSEDAYAAHAAIVYNETRRAVPMAKREGGRGAFNGVKVFSATMAQQRGVLGETVTRWLEEARRDRPGFQLVSIEIYQSSDSAYHCTTIVVTYDETLAAKRTAP